MDADPKIALKNEQSGKITRPDDPTEQEVEEVKAYIRNLLSRKVVNVE